MTAPDSTAIAQRLAALRAQLSRRGYAALVVPRGDEFLGEYIPAHRERLRWLSGFTGSAGVAWVTARAAALFVDGRYTVQVRRQVPADQFDCCHLPDDPQVAWLAAQLDAGDRVACDPRLHSLQWFRDTGRALAAAGLELVAEADNLVDACWRERPPEQVARGLLLGPEYTGESSLDKRHRIAAAVRQAGADALLVFQPDALSWLLNVRGRDLPQLPVLPACGFLAGSGELTLLVNTGRLPAGFDGHVGDGVQVLPEDATAAVIDRFAGRRVLADPLTANAWLQLALERAGAELVAGDDPVQLAKACKNATELAGARRAHRRDAVAEIRFLAWLDAEVAAGRRHDEAVLADHLLSLRREVEHFQACSFATISAAGANAALCHYNHLNGEPAALPMDSVYLVDSGGQYLDGTTDITRTVAIGSPGDEVRRLFTLVLKGHIALATARFPRGTSGSQLDALARQFLWREGFDYDHGTGHGVGAFLSVHEGPQRIAKQPNTVPLLPGMIVSDEPGYYRDGAFGMRCENLLAVREEAAVSGERPMLGFETLTLVPFDSRLVEPALLTAQETRWLDDYHHRVRTEVGPLLPSDVQDWLQRATRPLAS